MVVRITITLSVITSFKRKGKELLIMQAGTFPLILELSFVMVSDTFLPKIISEEQDLSPITP